MFINNFPTIPFLKILHQVPHALSMLYIWEYLTNSCHDCLTTICAKGQTRWGTYSFLNPLHEPNLVLIGFKINDSYCNWVHPVIPINCTSNA